MPWICQANLWQVPGARSMGGIWADGTALLHLMAGFQAGTVLFVLWGWAEVFRVALVNWFALLPVALPRGELAGKGLAGADGCWPFTG